MEKYFSKKDVLKSGTFKDRKPYDKFEFVPRGHKNECVLYFF